MAPAARERRPAASLSMPPLAFFPPSSPLPSPRWKRPFAPRGCTTTVGRTSVRAWGRDAATVVGEVRAPPRPTGVTTWPMPPRPADGVADGAEREARSTTAATARVARDCTPIARAMAATSERTARQMVRLWRCVASSSREVSSSSPTRKPRSSALNIAMSYPFLRTICMKPSTRPLR